MMTREKYMKVVDQYNKLLQEVRVTKMTLKRALQSLSEQDSLNEDEEGYQEWLSDVYEGLSGVLE